MNVLICEDDALIATMLEDLVSSQGHDVCGVASSAEAALALAASKRVDFALVDLDLLDGPTGLQLVGDLDALGIRSAIVSGGAQSVRSEDTRAVARFGKPVEERRLAEVLAAQATC